MIFPRKMFIEVKGQFYLNIYVQGEWEKNCRPHPIFIFYGLPAPVFRNLLSSHVFRPTNDRSDIKNIPPVFKSWICTIRLSFLLFCFFMIEMYPNLASWCYSIRLYITCPYYFCRSILLDSMRYKSGKGWIYSLKNLRSVYMCSPLNLLDSTVTKFYENPPTPAASVWMSLYPLV